MAIIDLQPKQGNVDIIVHVVEKDQPREFEKFGKKGKVCNVIVKDSTGSISLTLWNDDVERIKVGDQLHIKNGYVNEWQGKKQLTTGKFGSIEKVEDVLSSDENSIVKSDIDNTMLEEELAEIEEEDKDLKALDELENSVDGDDTLSKKEIIEDDLVRESNPDIENLEKMNEEFNELEKEQKELDNLIVVNEESELKDVDNKLKKIETSDFKDDDAITLDELEEVNVLDLNKPHSESENTADEKMDEDVSTKDESEEYDIDSDLIEEDVIDLDEKENENV